MIELDDVHRSFGDAVVLDGLSATVEAGELVGLVGPNGAGKTTLLRTVTGALAPDAGQVRVDGDVVQALSSAAASRRVAVVPQETHLSFSFAVRDLVGMGRHPYRSRFGRRTHEDRRRVERALERTRTATLADRPVDELSGGERQRVLLARALAQDAPALLLDEPTSSLDVDHAIDTMELVRDLVDEGRCAIAAIHDLELAARYCDRIAMLAGGEFVAIGPPEAVLETDRIEAGFDARTAIEPDPVTGGLAIDALPATAAGPRVHVLGGGELAAAAVGSLGAAGAELSIGPVPTGDRSIPTARSFDARIVETPRFADPTDDAIDRARSLVAAADVAVLATEAPRRRIDPWASLATTATSLVVVGDGAPTTSDAEDGVSRDVGPLSSTIDDLDVVVERAANGEAGDEPVAERTTLNPRPDGGADHEPDDE